MEHAPWSPKHTAVVECSGLSHSTSANYLAAKGGPCTQMYVKKLPSRAKMVEYLGDQINLKRLYGSYTSILASYCPNFRGFICSARYVWMVR